MGFKEIYITNDLNLGVKVPINNPDMKSKVFYVFSDVRIDYVSINWNFVGKENRQKFPDGPESVKLCRFMGKNIVSFYTIIFPSTLIGAD